MRLSDFMQGDSNRETGPEAKKLNDHQYDEAEGDSLVDQGLQQQESEPTPEEQEAYDRVVLAGIKVLNESSDQILALLQKGSGPAQSLADATWLLMSAIDEQAGGKIEEEILLSAGAEVLEQMSELAKEAGVFDVDQNVLNQSYQLILARFSEEFGVDFGEEMREDVEATDAETLIAQMGG